MKNKETNKTKPLLSSLPSVDEMLKGKEGMGWLASFPRTIVLQAVRDVISTMRENIMAGLTPDMSDKELSSSVTERISQLLSFSLIPVINATGIVLHTNLGRAVLSDKAIENVVSVSRGYSNLEYDIAEGRRGKRHTHLMRIVEQITGAADSFVVNNNAAAVFICLNTLAKDKEVIVSRGELVEIGGSFRVPDVMTSSGAVLREVGTTNKTHFRDYSNAINEKTGLILKVHQSNYKITGFTEDVPVEKLVELGRANSIPVMYDLGSGCLVDMKPFGIHDEPSVQEIVKTGVSIVSFSGDKLLGGPQGGIIVGDKVLLDKIRKNPLARALRVDKMTIAALEATLAEYNDMNQALQSIPVLQMLSQPLELIRARAKKISSYLRKSGDHADIVLIEDLSRAGGGSLPDAEFRTFAVSIKPNKISVNDLEAKLRRSSPPVIARIRDGLLLLDARTVKDSDVQALARVVSIALEQ